MLAVGRPGGDSPSATPEEPRSLRHVLDARQFSRDWLEGVLFPGADRLQRTPIARLPKPLKDKRLFYLFYETSTRTRVSFEAATSLLGGTVTGIDSHEHTPDEERLEDRIRVLNQYAYDLILLRYHEEGGASRAAAVSDVPIINAGDGRGQHPTQALLDAYTLWREFGTLDGLRIALVGDLSYERSTNSLGYLLAQFRDLQIYLVSPRILRVRGDVREHLLAGGARVEEITDLRSVASELDVVYVTRAQTPRLEHAQRLQAEAGWYSVDADVLGKLPASARVLHPLPRGEELPPSVDADSRVIWAEQARNGLYVRMALLSLLVGR